MPCQNLCDNLHRKKPVVGWLTDSSLRRRLSVFDLTSLGVGTVVGIGVYVVAGELARDVAGPAIVLSFILAFISAILCLLAYAEFSSRISKAGSAYIYTYVTLGEIWAFIVGWNIVLEYIIVGASLARACSEYIDTLFHGQIYRFFMQDIVTWNVPGIALFPDFLAGGLVIAAVMLVCSGVRISTNVQKAVTVANFLIILFMIIYGILIADLNQWTNRFAPYGFRGVLQGAASCFFIFVGLDVITTAAEETIHPSRNIPLSLLLSISISTLALLGVTTVLIAILPYHELDTFAPLATAFAKVGKFPVAKYIVACGGISATISALVCVVFSPSRLLYSMSLDGLFFGWFSHVSDSTYAPVRATIFVGCFAAVLAVIFDLHQLVELLSIGTLLAYTMVTISVLVTRYQPDVESVYDNSIGERKAITVKWLQSLCLTHAGQQDGSHTEVPLISGEQETVKKNDRGSKKEPTQSTAFRVKLSVFFMVVGITAIIVILYTAFEQISKMEWWAMILICSFSGITVISFVAILLQPKNNTTFPFMVPGVPYIPTVSIFLNVLLITNLQWITFARFGAWMVVGLLIYVLYGYHKSTQALKPSSQKQGEFVLHETPDFPREVKQPQMKLTKTPASFP